MSKMKSLTGAAAMLLGTSLNVSALSLATRGMGQVLEFPYYTVTGNQGTLFTIVNSTSDVKALKARFREAWNGRVVASFNVYLSPFDVWVAEIFDDNGTVAIGTRDNSCTVPAFDVAATHLNLPALAFSTQSFTGANSDTGPTDASRLTEGHFEIFEMGVVDSDAHQFQTDIGHVNGVPPGCAALANAWNPGGVWAVSPDTDMWPPGGGLYGSEAVVDVANGTYFAILPTVLDGFSSSTQNTGPADAAPDFDTASAGSDGTVSVSVDTGGKLSELHYAKSVDAVSALFMTSQQLNEYEKTATLGAQADWVATFPTKHFYVDPMASKSDSVLPPFQFNIGEATDGASCVGFDLQVFDRDEMTETPSACGFGECPPGSGILAFCREASVLTLAASGSALRTKDAESLASLIVFDAGHVIFDFAGRPDSTLAASTEGTVFTGLPAVGFLAENFVNANVTPGVLANYSFAIPHRSTITCATADRTCP